MQMLLVPANPAIMMENINRASHNDWRPPLGVLKVIIDHFHIKKNFSNHLEGGFYLKY